MDTTTTRTARKRHKCATQAYWDRLGTDEKRAYYGARECPEGGWIEPGTRYVESEGVDQFHPERSHEACYRAVVR